MFGQQAEWLLGIPAPEAFDDPKRVLKEFPNACAVLVTAGSKGAAFSVLGVEGNVPVFPVRAVETTGAGDAFMAGFLHGVLSAQKPELNNLLANPKAYALVPKVQRRSLVARLIKFASACGALTCTRMGAIAAQPSADEVGAFLLEQEQANSGFQGVRFLNEACEADGP